MSQWRAWQMPRRLEQPTASGATTPAITARPNTRRSIKSTKTTSRRLKIAWRHPARGSPRFTAANPTCGCSNNFRATPIMVGGVLYASNGVGLAEAFDPGTGKTLWVQKPSRTEGIARQHGEARRGVLVRREPKRASHATRAAILYALDPKTGRTDSGFRRRRQSRPGGRPAAPSTGRYRWNSTPLVVRDVVVIGSAMADRIRRRKMEGAARRRARVTTSGPASCDGPSVSIPRPAKTATRPGKNESWRVHAAPATSGRS